jgi:hypothetical protein
MRLHTSGLQSTRSFSLPAMYVPVASLFVKSRSQMPTKGILT